MWFAYYARFLKMEYVKIVAFFSVSIDRFFAKIDKDE